jgi:hypothetical protein
MNVEFTSFTQPAQSGPAASASARVFWWAWSLAALALVACVVWGVLFGSGPGQAGSGSRALEDGPIERASVGLWFSSAVLALGMLPACPTRPGRWSCVLLGVLALLAGLRELDAHIMLNPESLGSLGVRYRLDWWTDPGVPWVLKAGWGAVFVGVVASVLVPAVRSGSRPVRQLRAGHPATWLLAAAVALLGCGWAIDDLMRGVLPAGWSKLVEESVELCGAVAYLGAVAATITRPA